MGKIALVGTVYMDIKGFTMGEYDPVGRNIGEVRFVHGGVGRNVAENLAELGCEVVMVAAVDDNANGEAIISRLQQRQIDTSHMIKAPAHGMGFWLAILNGSGDLTGSLSTELDFGYTSELLDREGEQIMAEVSHVVLEIDLRADITRKVLEIAARQHKPVFALPGHMSDAFENPAGLARFECFICNDIEFGKLALTAVDTGCAAAVQRELTEFCQRLQIKMMVVTMGDKGVVYYSRGMKLAEFMPVESVEMVDSTGAGDSFFSGTLAALADGKTLAEAVQQGAAVAAYTIRSKESTCIGYREHTAK